MIKEIVMFNNKFTGKIPESLFQSTITYINISDNELTGKIPSWKSEINNLSTIDVSYNKLSGEIPLEMFNMKKFPKLVRIIAANNELTGKLPDIIKTRTLVELNFDYNKLTGGLPSKYPNRLNALKLR
eukprot:UN30490